MSSFDLCVALLASCAFAVTADSLTAACRDEITAVNRKVKKRVSFHGTEGAEQDLLDFTGLSRDELAARVRGHRQHNEFSEHAFVNPQSATELAWYYAHSAAFLFQTATHVTRPLVKHLTRANEPVLDFSGGAGNNVIWLARRNISSVYTGIGMLEYAFAEYRVRRHGLSAFVKLVPPYDATSGWKLDALAAFRPPSEYGTILAFDVLEHIPHYERTVHAMVGALRVGGLLCEFSPFAHSAGLTGSGNNATEDTRIHITNGGVPLAEAMGTSMQLLHRWNGFPSVCVGMQRRAVHGAHRCEMAWHTHAPPLTSPLSLILYLTSLCACAHRTPIV